jgi:hypothetical protein
MVKFNEQERLVLYISKKVIFTDEIKYVRSAESQEKWEGFAWLTIGGVTEREEFEILIKWQMVPKTYSSAKHSIRIVELGAVAPFVVGDDANLSNSDWTATMMTEMS